MKNILHSIKNKLKKSPKTPENETESYTKGSCTYSSSDLISELATESAKALLDQRIASLRSKKFTARDLVTMEFPNFNELVRLEKKFIFIKKCLLCCVKSVNTCPSSVNDKNADDCKTERLRELSNHVLTPSGWFSEESAKAVAELANCNLFRHFQMPEPPAIMGFVTQKVASRYSAQTRPIFELLTRVVQHFSLDQKLLLLIITPTFVERLIFSFEALDYIELYVAQDLLHKVYSHMICHRIKIRRHLRVFFQELAGGERGAAGANHLLRFYTSIVKGFARPLKQEHVSMLKEAVLPIFRSCHLPKVDIPLKNCLDNYINLDESLVSVVVYAVSRFSFGKDANKVVSILQYLEKLINEVHFDWKHEPAAASSLVRTIAERMADENSKVAMKAFDLLQVPNFRAIVLSHENTLGPLMRKSALKAQEHWYDYIREKGDFVLGQYLEADVKPLKSKNGCDKNDEGKSLENKSRVKERVSKWEELKNSETVKMELINSVLS